MFRTKPLLLLMIMMIVGMIAVSVVAEMVKVMLVGKCSGNSYLNVKSAAHGLDSSVVSMLVLASVLLSPI